MINVTTFAFTGYPMADVARSRAFYEGLLRLKPSSVVEHDDGKLWIEYDLGDTTLALNNVSEQWKPSADGPAIACEVADFDAAIFSLRDAGVEFTVGPTDCGSCWLAVVLDPSGNSVAIHHRKLQTPSSP